MRRSLSDLICDDLSELANYSSDVIASEEAISCIVALYKNKNKLHNIHILHKSELQSFLKNTLDVETLKNTQGHHQFLIEVGSRSNAHQRAPETIHYCSVDLYFKPGQKPLAFVADQYRGHDGYYTEFSKIAEELGFHFAVPGGDIFQADSVHCPVFSINHLLLTANDPTIPDLLDSIVGGTTDKTHTLFSWHELPPNYLYSSQSISMLFKYIAHLKSKSVLPEEHAIPILENSKFATFLHSNLYPDFKLNNKVRNRSIKTLAAHMADQVVLTLENSNEFDEGILTDLCYQGKYPEVHRLLRKALEISNKFPITEEGILQAHPLFELAFSFAAPMEICLKNKNFQDIFSDEMALELMQKGLLNSRDLFEAMVTRPKEIVVNKSACNVVKTNLPGIKIVASCLQAHPEVDSQKIGALLMSKNCSAFFKNPILSELFKKGLLSIEHIDKILAYKIVSHVFANLMSDTERLEYLDKEFLLGLDLKSVDEDIFSVPNVTYAEATISDKKPVINIGLLAKSMSKSIFTSERKTNEDIVYEPQGTVVFND